MYIPTSEIKPQGVVSIWYRSPSFHQLFNYKHFYGEAINWNEFYWIIRDHLSALGHLKTDTFTSTVWDFVGHFYGYMYHISQIPTHLLVKK